MISMNLFGLQCSRSCGGGFQKRAAQCVDDYGHVLADSICAAEDRLTHQPCNVEQCPKWEVGDWTPVSHSRRLPNVSYASCVTLLSLVGVRPTAASVAVVVASVTARLICVTSAIGYWSKCGFRFCPFREFVVRTKVLSISLEITCNQK